MAPDGDAGASGDDGGFSISMSEEGGDLGGNAPGLGSLDSDFGGMGDPYGSDTLGGWGGGTLDGGEASDPIADITSLIGSRAQSMIDNPGATLTNFGVSGILGGAPLGLAALGPIGMGIATANTISGMLGGPTIGSMAFGEPEGWSPASDDDAGAVANAANTGFADAAGIGGLGNNGFGDPSGMGGQGNDGGYMPSDPSNMMAQQAVQASAAPPPSLFQPQQPQQQPWRPNMWSGNNFIMPG